MRLTCERCACIYHLSPDKVVHASYQAKAAERIIGLGESFNFGLGPSVHVSVHVMLHESLPPDPIYSKPYSSIRSP